MKQLEFTIIDKIGLHARPASKLAQVASKFESEILLHSGEKKGNVKSVINLMALGVKNGTEVKLVINGADEDKALEALKEVILAEKIANL